MTNKIKILGLLCLAFILGAGAIELFFSDVAFMKIVEMILMFAAALIGIIIFGNKKNYQPK